MYIARLKRYDSKLHFVITLTEDRALAQARAADGEIAAGKYRGGLHGIPWGAKDLLAVKGYPTTWGAGGFEHQSFDEDATVVQRLDAAGAVLVAKFTLGALAMGDKWFGGRTRNPWNPEQGSSGSSAGSASAVAAGCAGLRSYRVGRRWDPCRRPARRWWRYTGFGGQRSALCSRTGASGAELDHGQAGPYLPLRGRLRPGAGSDTRTRRQGCFGGAGCVPLEPQDRLARLHGSGIFEERVH